MTFASLLKPGRVLSNVEARSKKHALDILSELLASAADLDQGDIFQSLISREKLGCTAIENGIAIPHGKTDSVDCLIAALGIKRSGVDFGALDGQPSTIFVMTVSPDSRTGPHIQFLAEISRPLNDSAVRSKILAATSREEVLKLLIA